MYKLYIQIKYILYILLEELSGKTSIKESSYEYKLCIV